MRESVHKSVLLKETIDGLNLTEGALVIDATYGGGGHSAEILQRFPKARIIAYDRDGSVWKDGDKRIEFRNDNFRNLDAEQEANGIIFDFGLSSDQLESSGRGFSFMKDEPLLMTMKENPSSEDLTAIDVVNGWSEKSLALIIRGYGEERHAKRIAGAIAEAREKKKIETSGELRKIIEESVPGSYRRGRLHFATRTFQAIRMAVNDELGAIEEALPKAYELLAPGGRMAMISFHSLEDRIVKRFGKEHGRLITKKPITASEEEIINNPRARSAKLRIIEKI